MNIFKSKIDDTLIYDVLYNSQHQLIVEKLIKNSSSILRYFQELKIKEIDIDSFLNYIVCKYILSIQNENEKLVLLKKGIRELIIEKYQIKSIVEFIEKEYLNIKSLTKDTKEQLISIRQIIYEIKEKNIKGVNLEKLFTQYCIPFFECVELFYKNNKNMIFKMLTKENIIKPIVDCCAKQLFTFLRTHSKEIKKSRYYSIIIAKVYEEISSFKNIYQKEEWFLQFVYLLEDLKNSRVHEMRKLYKDVLEERNRFVAENGIVIKDNIDSEESYEKLEAYLKKDKGDLRTKFLKCFVTQRRGKCQLLLNDIDRKKLPITDVLIANSHSYYRPFRKLCFKNIYLQTSMETFMDIYIKNYGYEEIEKTLENLFEDIYRCVIFNDDDKALYKQEAKNIVNTIKNFKEIKSSYTNYVDVFYISSVLERLLRQIFMNTCLNRDLYMKNYTLKEVFDENSNKNLKIVIGETLYRWLKYFLYVDREEKDGFIIKEGWDIRNSIAHGKYKITDDLSEIYYILIYLLINLLWSVDLRMLVYPTSKTERILKKSFKNSI